MPRCLRKSSKTPVQQASVAHIISVPPPIIADSLFSYDMASSGRSTAPKNFLPKPNSGLGLNKG